jgi:histidine ammonia-lyase
VGTPSASSDASADHSYPARPAPVPSARGPAVVLDGRHLTPARLVEVARGGAPVRLSRAAAGLLVAQRSIVDAAVASGAPTYGVNTGLGARVTSTVPTDELAEMSVRTIRGRATAVGPPLPADVVTAVTATRVNQMAGGGSGVHPAVAGLLVDMINAGLVAEIPSIGSIGASDLCQLAHLSLVVIGEGWGTLRGRRLPGAAALAHAGLTPAILGPKDGLALCNSSAVSAAMAALALADVDAVLGHAYAVVALSFEGFRANTIPARAEVLAAHGAPGSERAGMRLLDQLAGSGLLEPSSSARRLQDPLSWRCVPQVHGALEAAIDFARPAVHAELNGSSDNPLVLGEWATDDRPATGRLVSTGNFQPATLALALDTVALGLHQVAALSAARTSGLLAPALTGLAANLSSYGPGRSGFAAVVKVVQALMAQIKRLAAPTYDDPRPGAADVEDNSTNASLGGQRLAEMAELTRLVFAAEALVAAQAAELAAPTRMAAAPAALLAAIRDRVPPLDDDRSYGPDIEAVADLLVLAGRRSP